MLDDYVRPGDVVQDDLRPVAVTAREREIIQLVAEGQSSKKAASSVRQAWATSDRNVAAVSIQTKMFDRHTHAAGTSSWPRNAA